METILIIGLVFNLLISLLVSKWASKVNLNSLNVFFISFLLSPIIGLLYIIIFKDNENMKVKKEHKQDGKYEVYEYIGYLIFILITLLLIMAAISKLNWIFFLK